MFTATIRQIDLCGDAGLFLCRYKRYKRYIKGERDMSSHDQNTSKNTRNNTLKKTTVWRSCVCSVRLSLSAFLLSGLFLSGCKDKNDKEGGDAKNKVFELKEAGVKLTAPGDWTLKKRGNEWVLQGGMKGVIIQRSSRDRMISSAEEAEKRFAESKILETEKLKNGGFYVFYEMKFPTRKGEEPMMLKFVYSIIELSGGETALCRVQLQKDDEKAIYEPICKSMQKI